MKLNTLSVGLALILSATVSAEDVTAPAVTGGDELVKQKSGKWAEVWVNPDADFADYDNLYLWQSVFQFRDVDDGNVNQTTTAMLRRDQGPYAMDEESKAMFEHVVSDVVVKELNRSKQFTIVDEIGPRTLAVRGLVLDIVSNVPPDVGRRANVHLANVGEATFIFELVDASTGVIQARVGDRRFIKPPSQINQVSRAPVTSATVWNDVELWARDQAMTLRKELDKKAKKAKKQ